MNNTENTGLMLINALEKEYTDCSFPKKKGKHYKGNSPTNFKPCMNNLLYRLALKSLTRYNRDRKSFTPINIFLEKLIHYSRLDYYPDFKNPRIWSEFICNRKFYHDQQLLANTADKLKSRDYVEQKLGSEYLTNLYDVLSAESELSAQRYKSYPIPFIVKPNHASERIYLNDKDNYDKFRKETSGFLSEFGNRSNELYYKLIKPKLMIEEYLDSSQTSMMEFKFWTFHGKVELIAASGNIRSLKQQQQYHFRLYDRNWKDSNIQVRNSSPDRIEKPEQLELMIELSETLAQGWDFIRVDFMKTQDRLIFGELTTVPSGGRLFGISLDQHRYLFDHYVRRG